MEVDGVEVMDGAEKAVATMGGVKEMNGDAATTDHTTAMRKTTAKGAITTKTVVITIIVIMNTTEKTTIAIATSRAFPCLDARVDNATTKTTHLHLLVDTTTGRILHNLLLHNPTSNNNQ